ncbi:MAG: hypothetical protein ACRC7C_12700 [Beijerinckiaceae bacterium]
MWYLTTTLIWLVLLALALGVFVGWRACSKTPKLEGFGWLGIALVVFVFGLLAAAMKVFKGVPGLALDTALILFAAFIVGCCIGCLFGRGKAAAPVAAVAAVTPVVAAVARTAPVAAPAPKPAGPATVRPYQWQAAKDTTSVTLTGYAPSDEARTKIAAAARSTLAPAPVIDKMQLGGGAPVGLESMAITSFSHLAKLDRGIASLIDSKYTLTGVAGSRTSYDDVMGGVKALPTGFSLAKVDVVAPPAAKAPVATSAATGIATTVASAAATEKVVADKAAADKTAADKAAADKAAADKAAADTAAAEKASLAQEDEPPAAAMIAGEENVPGKRPRGLASPRGGKADDLKCIRGIGKQNEARLHGLGIWHFDQVASWSADEALWVGSYLAFPGRIEREEWLSQAKVLATGADTEFSKRVARGEVATSVDDGSKGQGSVEKLEPIRPVKGTPPEGGNK